MISNPTFSQMLDMAIWERRLMWSILASILANVASNHIGLFVIPVAIAVIGFQLVCIWKLSVTAEIGWLKWVIMLLMFFPFISLVTVVILVVRVNRLFKEKDVPVGLMGPDINFIRKKIELMES